jgi:hypothetical protein
MAFPQIMRKQWSLEEVLQLRAPDQTRTGRETGSSGLFFDQQRVKLIG